jgi:hypothetical protein
MRDGDPTSPTWGQWFGYGARWARDNQRFADEAGRLINGPLFASGVEITPHPFSFLPTDRILIGGCGFGYLIDAFKTAGFPNCWGIDKSPHIDSHKATESPEGIILVGEDIAGGQAKAALRAATGDDEFHWVISESVLESFDNTDPFVSALFDAANGVLFRDLTPPQGDETWRAIHLVSTNPDLDPTFNVQDIDAWAALRTDQTWVSYNDWEARVGAA